MFKRIALIPSLAALLLVVLTVNLGAWQLRRADEKRLLASQNEAVQKGVPRAWQTVPDGQALPPGWSGRAVTVRGQFVPEKTVLLDNRSRNGVAGLYVFTPLQLSADSGAETGGHATHVLVLRGWVARSGGDHARLPQFATPAGQQELTGLVLADMGKAPYFAAGVSNKLGVAWPHIDLAQYAITSRLRVQPMILRQFSDNADGLVRDWGAPANEVDKHLAYAFQWFALALTVFGLWLYFSLIKPNQDADSTQTPDENPVVNK